MSEPEQEQNQEQEQEQATEKLRLDREALAFARSCARSLGLELKLFRVERSAEGDRTVFFLSAERRLELKELAQALAERFPERLELRQVGVRDEAKLVGGIGSCGRELCCTTFLPRFAPVTIRMAKNQNLALNPTRVTGQCGRLKCCLVYEEAQYVEARQALPRIGAPVATPDGPGEVETCSKDLQQGRAAPPAAADGAQPHPDRLR